MPSRMPKLVVVSCALALALALAACAGQSTQGGSAQGGQTNLTSLEAYPVADMSGYDCAPGYDTAYRFRTMTVAEVAAEMDKGSTFVLYAGYNHCPWCNSMLNPLNDVATERGIDIAYIDTRADPSWQSNMDMADYDLFVECFGDVLELDDDGKKHLYVPHMFFVKDGKLVGDHPGTVSSQENSSDPLTQAQIEELKGIINEHIDAIA